MLTVVGNLGHFVALLFCDLTVIACNTSSAVIMNVFISWKWLGEKFVPKYDVTAIILVFAGTLLILLMANKDHQTFDTNALLKQLTTPQSLAYYGVTIILAITSHCLVPKILKTLKAFEADCEQWEADNAPLKVLPDKKQAVDEEGTFADRPDRELMYVLNGLSREAVQMISPKSLFAWKWLKVPLMAFSFLSAMISSLSELSMKVIGVVMTADADHWTDYLWLILFIPMLVFTAILTLVYINYGIKYYNQMELMPIYQTSLLINNILVGMICLNEF